MKTIAIANQKGGIGKTTTALMTATGLLHCGYKVLFVDIDPQCNSTSSYKAVTEDTYTLYDLMNDKCSTKEAIQTTAVGDIIACDELLTTDESKFLSRMGGFNILKNKLKEVQDEYDFCVIDTPPDLGIFMYNALCAADGTIIPVRAEKYAVDGLSRLISTINDVVSSANPNLKIYGVLFTCYDIRNKLDKNMWKALPKMGKNFGFNVFKTPIRICQAIKDSQANGTNLFDVNPSSNAARDYAQFLRELLKEV
ncbi:MAG: ParA family protein [Lachnospiraceae bacterium]|nr:ParA family protein [Lachnospiraceae bacterium]